MLTRRWCLFQRWSGRMESFHFGLFELFTRKSRAPTGTNLCNRNFHSFRTLKLNQYRPSICGTSAKGRCRHWESTVDANVNWITLVRQPIRKPNVFNRIKPFPSINMLVIRMAWDRDGVSAPRAFRGTRPLITTVKTAGGEHKANFGGKHSYSKRPHGIYIHSRSKEFQNEDEMNL